MIRYIKAWLAERWASTLIKLVLGAIVGFSMIEWVNSGPAVVIEALDEVDALVAPGDNTISFVLKVDRNHTCPVAVARYLWRWVPYRGQQIREFRSIDNPSVSPDPVPGQSTYMLTLTVPPGLPPGPWFERTVSIQECPMLGHLFGSPPHISADHPITIKSD